MRPYRSTGMKAHHDDMGFEVVLRDDTIEWVEGAASYQQEGPMTTFFDNGERPSMLDAWSVKLASYRTDRIVRIRRMSLAA